LSYGRVPLTPHPSRRFLFYFFRLRVETPSRHAMQLVSATPCSYCHPPPCSCYQLHHVAFVSYCHVAGISYFHVALLATLCSCCQLLLCSCCQLHHEAVVSYCQLCYTTKLLSLVAFSILHAQFCLSLVRLHTVLPDHSNFNLYFWICTSLLV